MDYYLIIERKEKQVLDSVEKAVLTKGISGKRNAATYFYALKVKLFNSAKGNTL